jgi:hypothetical protein
MAKKKKIDYTPYIIGAGALGVLAYAFKDDIKNLFKPKEETNDNPPIDPNLIVTPVIENVVTTNGVTPVATNVTPGLNVIGTPKEKLNLNQNLKFGDRGQEVAKLQQILNRIAKITGKPMIKEDGVWGDGSEARIKNMFTSGTINLYKLYAALFAIYAADVANDKKNWFKRYEAYLKSPAGLYQDGRKLYFANNTTI